MEDKERIKKALINHIEKIENIYFLKTVYLLVDTHIKKVGS